MDRHHSTLFGKIFGVLFAVSFLVMATSTFAATAASFSSYENEAARALLSETDSYAHLLKGKTSQQMGSFMGSLPLDDTRCTLIDKDGKVFYDNWADPSTMENHASRDEVAQARNQGQASVMRRSETMGSDTLYAAVQLNDGIVLRLAETRTSMASFLSGMTLQLGVSLGIIVFLSFLVSSLLTSRIIRPLRQIDLSHPLDNNVYQEMRPLLKRVDDQRCELERQNAELERAMEARREFTGNVSHEMKTPLQVISGYAELMQYGVVKPEDNARFAGLIVEEAGRMRELIDDVLTLSRLDEQGDRASDPVDLAPVCESVVDRLRPAAEERDIRIDLDVDKGLVVLGAQSLAQQLVYNLVDNAVRYNRDGGKVTVGLHKRTAAEVGAKPDARGVVALPGDAGLSAVAGASFAELSVSDQGKGVPEEYRTRIFERFFRVDASHSRETGGTGLGLAIVKHAVASFGGSVCVGDAEGGGARFVVLIPLAKKK